MKVDRWSPLRYHAEQQRLWRSRARFRVVPAGRRSGKTEIAKRAIALAGMEESELRDAWCVYAAPTHDQAKRIAWDDLCALVPRALVRRKLDGQRTLRLVNGAEISTIGADRAERLEGRPIDGIILDEFGNMKPDVWAAHIRPALSTPGRRPGWAWLIGVPEGRNHYYALRNEALLKKAEAVQAGKPIEWDVFAWHSADLLSPDEIAAARKDLDPLTFRQEYEADFVNFSGRAYYTFDREVHAKRALGPYDPNAELGLCFDFNKAPGVAVVVQEIALDGAADTTTCVIGEVHIPSNSNTPQVCERLAQDWGQHRGSVCLYGDASGGAGGSAKVQGSDWDLVLQTLRPVFGDRLIRRIPEANPRERARVNAVNSRVFRGRLRCDPARAPHTIEDLESVILVEGGVGKIDKLSNPAITHLSDALGYYVVRRFPVIEEITIQGSGF